MSKRVGFTPGERNDVVRQCKVIGEQVNTLLKQVNGRIYARHLDRLCRIANDFPFFADEFEHSYPVVDDPVVRCPMCKKGIPAGQLDSYKAYCHECQKVLNRATADADGV